jgi:hypothetical protein
MSAFVLPSTSPAASPHPHSVQFYSTDEELFHTLQGFIASALFAGDSLLLIATPPHLARLNQLKAKFKRCGVDLKTAIQQNRFITHDAAALLSTFMVEGWPDEARFMNTISRLITQIKAVSRNGTLAVHGEMVALLCLEGKHEAAARLEQLWNELAKQTPFHLYCAYPVSAFNGGVHGKALLDLCSEHVHLVPPEIVASLSQKNSESNYFRQRIELLQSAIQLRVDSDRNDWAPFEMDIDEELLLLSTKAQHLLGMKSSTVSLQEFVDIMYYSGDRDSFFAALLHARKGRKQLALKFRARVNGTFSLLSIQGKLLYNRGNSVVIGVLANAFGEG